MTGLISLVFFASVTVFGSTVISASRFTVSGVPPS